MKLFGRVLKEIEWHLHSNNYETEAEEKPMVNENALTELPEERLEEFVEQIVNACDNFDGEGVVHITKLLAVYSFRGLVLNTYFAPVGRLAEEFEYSQAAEAAKEALARVKEAEI